MLNQITQPGTITIGKPMILDLIAMLRTLCPCITKVITRNHQKSFMHNNKCERGEAEIGVLVFLHLSSSFFTPTPFCKGQIYIFKMILVQQGEGGHRNQNVLFVLKPKRMKLQRSSSVAIFSTEDVSWSGSNR